MADRVIEIIIETNDKTGGSLEGLKKSLLAMDAAAQRMANKLKSLANAKYAATLRLIDRVSEPGGRINALLKSLAGKTYRLTMSLTDGALNKLRQIEASLMKIAGKAWTVAVNVKDNIKSKLGGIADGALMGAGVMGVGMAGTAGIGYGAVNALQSYMGFEQAMSKVQAVRQLDKNSPEMIALTERAKEMGATTEWTRTEAAQAEYYMAMAGWDTDRIVKALPSVMHLASAGGTDLATTSDIVTDSMTGFGLKAGEMYRDSTGRMVEASQHYADIMAKTVTSSNTNIGQLGEALKYSSNVVGSMYAGKDIQTRMHATEDAMVMTGLMANAGIKASQAGTSTRAIFSRFGAENRNAYNALRAVGVNFTDENNEVRRIGDVMKDLSSRFKQGVDPNHILEFAEAISGEKIHADTRRKLNSFMDSVQKSGGKMTGADMLKMSSMLAGQEAMSGLLAVLMGDWDELAGKIKNAHGAAEEMAKIQLDNLSGDLKILGSAWDAFQQSLFEGQAGAGLRGFVKTLTDIISRVNKLFSDGIQVGDFANIIGDVVNRLKNKFLELDGVGSLLAGGALAIGLTKIARLAQRTIGYFRQLRGLEVGQRLSSTANPATGVRGVGAQNVGTMNVNAGVVNINGRIAGNVGGVGNSGSRTRTNVPPGILPAQAAAEKAALKAQQAQLRAQAAWAKVEAERTFFTSKDRLITLTQQARTATTRAQNLAANAALAQNAARVEAYNTRRAAVTAQVTQARGQEIMNRYNNLKSGMTATPATPSRFAGMKSAAGGGAAFAGIFAAMDIFNTRSMNEERLADAKNAVVLAQKAYEEQRSQGATQDVLAEYSRKIADAQQAQIQVVRENKAAELASGASAVGSVAGTALGAAIGSLAGPIGTMIGGMIGGIAGDKIGGLAAQFQAQNIPLETQKTNTAIVEQSVSEKLKPSTFEFKNPLNRQRDNTGLLTQGKFFDTNQPLPTPAPTSDYSALAVLGKGHGRSKTANLDADAWIAAVNAQTEVLNAQKPIYSGLLSQVQRVRGGEFIQGSYVDQNAPVLKNAEQAQEVGAQIGKSLSAGLNSLPETLATIFAPGSLLEKFLGENKAHAAELSPEQQAYQAAMERGEVSLPEAGKAPEVGEMPEVGELDGTSMIENLYSQLEGLGEGVQEIFTGLGDSITEGLQSALDGAGEVFSTFGTTISEGLTSAMDGASEIFSTFGATLSEGLTSAMDGAGEIFSGFGEVVTAGLESTTASATSALTAIQTAFTGTKEQIQSAWSELPSFFDGVFAGLGGAASAAGAAIAAGLTSVCGSVIGAWQSVASTVSSIIASISAAANSVASMIPSIGGGVAKAEGGFVAAETHFYAGEHGPEVVIPLSINRRARALDLFEKTAAILGGSALNFGGDEIVQDLPDLSDSLPLPTRDLPSVPIDDSPVQTSSTSKSEINVGGVNVTFEISGADNPQDLMEFIRSKMAEVADMVAGKLASAIDGVHQNQALEW